MKCEDVRMEIFCRCGIYTYLVQYAGTDKKTYVRYFLFSVDKSMYCKKEIKRTMKKNSSKDAVVFCQAWVHLHLLQPHFKRICLVKIGFNTNP